MFKNVCSNTELEILPCRNKEWRQPNIGKTSNDARIILTFKLNPSRELCYRLHKVKGISVILKEQDKSSDIEQLATATVTSFHDV